MRLLISPSTLVLLFFLFISFHATWGRDDESLIISNTCRNTSDGDSNISYGFCVTSLEAAPGGKCAGLRGLGRISIRLVEDNVTATRCHIKRLLRTNEWDAYTRQCLKDCFELYSDAIPTLEEAMKNYRSGRYDDANIEVSAVMEGFTTCEDGFTDRKGGASSPLTKRNADAFELSAISLAVMDMLS